MGKFRFTDFYSSSVACTFLDWSYCEIDLNSKPHQATKLFHDDSDESVWCVLLIILLFSHDAESAAVCYRSAGCNFIFSPIIKYLIWLKRSIRLLVGVEAERENTSVQQLLYKPVCVSPSVSFIRLWKLMWENKTDLHSFTQAWKQATQSISDALTAFTIGTLFEDKHSLQGNIPESFLLVMKATFFAL